MTHEGTFTCRYCSVEKPLSDFYKSSRNKTGHQYECKECMKKRVKESRSKNPEKYKAYARSWRIAHRDSDKNSARKFRYKNLYGMSIQDYDKMLEKQGGCCMICKEHHTDHATRLHVDHDHNTGKVRGLLCRRCNMLLGVVDDDVNLLGFAIQYLGESSAA